MARTHTLSTRAELRGEAQKPPLLVVQFPQQLAVLLLLLMVKSVQSLEVHLKRVQVPQILGLVN